MVNSQTHRAEWMAFDRLVKNNRRLPGELKNRLGCDDDGQAKLKLFNDWLWNGKDIQAVVLIARARTQLKRSLKKKWGWRTKQQMLKDLYFDDEPACKDVIKEKTTRGLWRPNPECPHATTQVQYWCLLDTTMEEEQNIIQEVVIEGADNIDPTSAMELLNQDTGMFGRLAVPGMSKNPALESRESAAGNAQPVGAAPGEQAVKKGRKEPKPKEPKLKLDPESPLGKAKAVMKKLEKQNNQCRQLAWGLKSLGEFQDKEDKLKHFSTELEAHMAALKKLIDLKVDADVGYKDILKNIKATCQAGEEIADLCKGIIVGCSKKRKAETGDAGTAEDDAE